MKIKSLLRREEYRALSQIRIDGEILDVGGARKSGYHDLFQGDHRFTIGNIDDSYGIDVRFDAERPWPFKEAFFEGVLFINVLEHLYRYTAALSEARRVLKPGGMIVGVVPFMFNVHGSPSDYFRYTRSTLERMLQEQGFEDVQVRELGTGAFSVVYHCLFGFMRWYWVAVLSMWFFTSLDRAIALLKPDNKMSAAYMPLGYVFTAIAPHV